MSAVRSPRRVLRPLRLLVFAAVALLAVGFARRYAVVRVPEGPIPLFGYTSGARLVAIHAEHDRAPEVGDALLYAQPEVGMALARFVARPGEALRIDEPGKRVARADGGPWYPAPPAVFARLPLRAGELLLLAEEPAARAAGAVVREADVVARVIVHWP